MATAGTCPECGKGPLSTDTVECPHCGSRAFILTEKYQKLITIVMCPQCLGQTRQGTEVCDFCGGKKKVKRYDFSVQKRDLRTGEVIFNGFEYEYSPL
jgi:hypothetical protein